MLPSASRVKINRIALKDVVGIRIVPRRKRKGTPLSDVTSEPRHQEVKQQQVSKEVPGKDTASAFTFGEPAWTEGAATGSKSMEAKKCRGDTPKSKRRKISLSTKDCSMNQKTVDYTLSTPSRNTAIEQSLRQAVTFTSSNLWGDCNYLKAQRQTMSKKEQPDVELRTTGSHSDADTKKISVYPTVTLCDIAQKCDMCTHNCGYKLPHILKSKRIHCFKRDMKTGSRFRPTCVWPNKQDRNEYVPYTNIRLCPKTKSKKGMCQRLTPNQRQMSSSKSSKFDFLNKDVEKDIRPQSECVKDFPDIQGLHCKDILRSNCFKKVHSGLFCDFDPCEESSGSSRTDYWAKKISKSPDYPYGQVCNSRDSELIEAHYQKNEVDANNQESFTCQRVQVYYRNVDKNISCARTYMQWPFLNSHCTFTANTDATVCQRKANYLSAGDNSDGSLNQNSIRSSNLEANHVGRFSDKVKDYSSNTTCQTLLNQVNETEAGYVSIIPTNKQGCALDASDFHLYRHSTCTEFEIVSVPGLSQSTPIKEPELKGSMSNPSTLSLGLSNWETTEHKARVLPNLIENSVSTIASPCSPSSDLAETTLMDSHSTSTSSCFLEYSVKSTETQLTCSSHTSSPVLLHSYDSSLFCESSYLLPQDGNNEGTSQLEPDNISTYSVLSDSIAEELFIDELPLSPIVSPICSPRGCMSWGKEKSSNNQQSLPGDDAAHMHEGSQNSAQGVGCGNEEISSNSTFVLSHNHGVPGIDGIQDELEKSKDEHQDSKDHVLSEKFPALVLSRQGTPSPVSSIERTMLPKMEKADEKEAAATERTILDEFSAYKRDILLVDVIEDDQELFESLPEKGLLKLGPTRTWTAPNTSSLSRCNTSAGIDKRISQVIANHPDVTGEDNSRPWRPHGSRNPPPVKMHAGAEAGASVKQTRYKDHVNVNNIHLNADPRRKGGLYSQTIDSQQKNIPFTNRRNSEEPRISNPTNILNFRPQKSHLYCRQYFSESLSCGFKMCRFQHVPVEGDEKFCMEKVTQFIKNPICLQKAGAVFSGYYLNNPPGIYFSMPVFLSLLWSLLKANMVADVILVLRAGLTHRIAPGPEFLLALYNSVREKGLVACVPELVQLTFKMAQEGIVLNLDWIECFRNTPEIQRTVCQDLPAPLSANQVAPLPEYLSLAHSIVEIELCAKQEDWKRMGRVFSSVCQSSHHPNNLEHICCRIAMALLSENKDKLTVPFATFAEAVYQNEGDNEDVLMKGFLGRIGISLMLRYHKTHQWAKGQKVVEVLSLSKISYSTLQGLFGNEDGASRCSLVTKATELFLLSGSVEGALSTLRENNWFQSSHMWPCKPADLTSRSHVLMRLAEKTSHRDTLEVLSNLPGIKEPNDCIDVCSYTPVFESHLQVCVERHILTVASDTVDFMFSNNLKVNQTILHTLLQKLGKQNQWHRAREVFKHALSVGYYPGVSAPSGYMALMVPSHLWEVELALTFEMFITVNATGILQLLDNTARSLGITLKRTQSSESEYLSAGSRLLCAAYILQPKLCLTFSKVNSSQEQVFSIDISSARQWLRHNHSWAKEVWTQWPTSNIHSMGFPGST